MLAHTTLRGTTPPAPPLSERVHETLGLLARLRRQSVLSVDIVVSRRQKSSRNFSIHRHLIGCRHGSTLQVAHGSLNPRDSVIRGRVDSR